MIDSKMPHPPSVQPLSRYITEHCCLTWGDFESRLRGPFLLIKAGNNEPRVLNLEDAFRLSGSELILGRSETCDIPLDDDTVSRAHARIHFSDGRYYFTDLDSSNGSFSQEAVMPGLPICLRDEMELRLGRSARLCFYELGSFYLLTYEDMKLARERLPQDQRRARGTTRRVTSQRMRPAAMLEAQRDRPRSAARLGLEMGGGRYEDFLRFFPYPVLLELATCSPQSPGRGKNREHPMETIIETAIAGQTSLGALDFWVLTSAVDSSCVLVGRASNNDVRLPYEGIARRHIEIRGEGEGEARTWTVSDLSDRAGVWVDGERVEDEATLPSSAALRLGKNNLFQFMSPSSFWDLLRLFHEYPYLYPA